MGSGASGKKRVIVVTDGDRVAQAAVEEAARNVGGRAISASAGNPTPLSGQRIAELIRESQGDPILVMVDDKGQCGEGAGERALEVIAGDPEIDLLGVIAVASNTGGVTGTEVDFSVAKDGKVVQDPVDKEGNRVQDGATVKGDTVEILNRMDVPVVVGMGDPGKMEKADRIDKGAPILTEAVRQILNRG